MSNLDATDLRLVCKGVTVKNAAGQVGTVVKTSRGACLVMWPGQRYANTEYCRELTVVKSRAQPVRRAALTPQQLAEAQDLRERARVCKAAGLRHSELELRRQLRAILSDER